MNQHYYHYQGFWRKIYSNTGGEYFFDESGNQIFIDFLNYKAKLRESVTYVYPNCGGI